MTTKCIVLDVDDTLYLERDYVRSGFKALEPWVLEHCGVDGFFEHAWGAFESGVRGKIFNAALDAMGVSYDRALIMALVRAYREHPPDITLLDDALRFIERVHGRYRLGVITDGPVSSQRAKVKALGLARWVPEETIMVTGELGEGMGKPHPRAYQRIEEVTGCRPQDCCYIADNPKKDFVAPHARGWMTVRMRREGGLHADVAGGEDIALEVNDFTELTTHYP